MKSTFIKTMSLIVTILFALNTAVMSAPGALRGFRVSKENAKVKETYLGESDETIVLIEDAHTSSEAQENIAGVIKGLKESSDVQLIALEGAKGKIDRKEFRQFPLRDIRDQAAKQLIKTGKFTGPEYAYISMEEAPKLFGVENYELYHKNLNLFRTVISSQRAVRPAAKWLEKSIKTLKSYIYSNDIKKLDKSSAERWKGEKGFLKYIETLEKLTEKARIGRRKYSNFKAFLDAKNIENSADFDSLPSEIGAYLADVEKKIGPEEDEEEKEEERAEDVESIFLFREAAVSDKNPPKEYQEAFLAFTARHEINEKEYPNLMLYRDFLATINEIEHLRLLEECGKISAGIVKELADTKAERKLFSLAEDFNVLIHLLELKAVGSEVKRLFNEKRTFRAEHFTEAIEELTGEAGISIPGFDVSAVDEIMPVVKDFYRTAKERNDYLVENTLAALRQSKEDAAVLVTGGFHTEGITKKLKSKKISYVVVSPKIEKAFDDLPYIPLMMGRKSPSDSLLEGLVSHVQKPLVLNGNNRAAEIALTQLDLATYYKYLLNAGLDSPDLKENLEALLRNSGYAESRIYSPKHAVVSNSGREGICFDVRGTDLVVSEDSANGFNIRKVDAVDYEKEARIVEFSGNSLGEETLGRRSFIKRAGWVALGLALSGPFGLLGCSEKSENIKVPAPSQNMPAVLLPTGDLTNISDDTRIEVGLTNLRFDDNGTTRSLSNFRAQYPNAVLNIRFYAAGLNVSVDRTVARLPLSDITSEDLSRGSIPVDMPVDVVNALSYPETVFIFMSVDTDSTNTNIGPVMVAGANASQDETDMGTMPIQRKNVWGSGFTPVADANAISFDTTDSAFNRTIVTLGDTFLAAIPATVRQDIDANPLDYNIVILATDQNTGEERWAVINLKAALDAQAAQLPLHVTVQFSDIGDLTVDGVKLDGWGIAASDVSPITGPQIVITSKSLGEEKEEGMTRRGFLKRASLFFGGLAIFGPLASCAPDAEDYYLPIPDVNFGTPTGAVLTNPGSDSTIKLDISNLQFNHGGTNHSILDYAQSYPDGALTIRFYVPGMTSGTVKINNEDVSVVYLGGHTIKLVQTASYMALSGVTAEDVERGYITVRMPDALTNVLSQMNSFPQQVSVFVGCDSNGDGGKNDTTIVPFGVTDSNGDTDLSRASGAETDLGSFQLDTINLFPSNWLTDVSEITFDATDIADNILIVNIAPGAIDTTGWSQELKDVVNDLDSNADICDDVQIAFRFELPGVTETDPADNTRTRTVSTTVYVPLADYLEAQDNGRTFSVGVHFPETLVDTDGQTVTIIPGSVELVGVSLASRVLTPSSEESMSGGPWQISNPSIFGTNYNPVLNPGGVSFDAVNVEDNGLILTLAPGTIDYAGLPQAAKDLITRLENDSDPTNDMQIAFRFELPDLVRSNGDLATYTAYISLQDYLDAETQGENLQVDINFPETIEVDGQTENLIPGRVQLAGIILASPITGESPENAQTDGPWTINRRSIFDASFSPIADTSRISLDATASAINRTVMEFSTGALSALDPAIQADVDSRDPYPNADPNPDDNYVLVVKLVDQQGIEDFGMITLKPVQVELASGQVSRKELKVNRPGTFSITEIVIDAPGVAPSEPTSMLDANGQPILPSFTVQQALSLGEEIEPGMSIVPVLGEKVVVIFEGKKVEGILRGAEANRGLWEKVALEDPVAEGISGIFLEGPELVITGVDIRIFMADEAEASSLGEGETEQLSYHEISDMILTLFVSGKAEGVAVTLNDGSVLEGKVEDFTTARESKEKVRILELLLSSRTDSKEIMTIGGDKIVGVKLINPEAEREVLIEQFVKEVQDVREDIEAVNFFRELFPELFREKPQREQEPGEETGAESLGRTVSDSKVITAVENLQHRRNVTVTLRSGTSFVVDLGRIFDRHTTTPKVGIYRVVTDENGREAGIHGSVLLQDIASVSLSGEEKSASSLGHRSVASKPAEASLAEYYWLPPVIKLAWDDVVRENGLGHLGFYMISQIISYNRESRFMVFPEDNKRGVLVEFFKNREGTPSVRFERKPSEDIPKYTRHLKVNASSLGERDPYLRGHNVLHADMLWLNMMERIRHEMWDKLAGHAGKGGESTTAEEELRRRIAESERGVEDTDSDAQSLGKVDKELSEKFTAFVRRAMKANEAARLRFEEMADGEKIIRSKGLEDTYMLRFFRDETGEICVTVSIEASIKPTIMHKKYDFPEGLRFFGGQSLGDTHPLFNPDDLPDDDPSKDSETYKGKDALDSYLGAFIQSEIENFFGELAVFGVFSMEDLLQRLRNRRRIPGVTPEGEKEILAAAGEFESGMAKISEKLESQPDNGASSLGEELARVPFAAPSGFNEKMKNAVQTIASYEYPVVEIHSLDALLLDSTPEELSSILELNKQAKIFIVSDVGASETEKTIAKFDSARVLQKYIDEGRLVLLLNETFQEAVQEAGRHLGEIEDPFKSIGLFFTEEEEIEASLAAPLVNHFLVRGDLEKGRVNYGFALAGAFVLSSGEAADLKPNLQSDENGYFVFTVMTAAALGEKLARQWQATARLASAA